MAAKLTEKEKDYRKQKQNKKKPQPKVSHSISNRQDLTIKSHFIKKGEVKMKENEPLLHNTSSHSPKPSHLSVHSFCSI